MSERHEHAPRCVYLLADSLDGILVACEDLQSSRFDRSQVFRLELAAITHVLHARRYIDALDGVNADLADQCFLFLAGTAPFELAALRSQGSTSERRAGSAPQAAGEDYLVGGHMPLGVLAHVTSAMLDALETTFVLYPDEVTPILPTAATNSEMGAQAS